MTEQPREPTDEEAAEGRVTSLASRAAAILRSIAVDTAPLHASRDYRLLWFGGLISFTGHQVTLVAVYYQVYQLTNSPAAVGLVGLVQLIPLAIASVGSGAIVDAIDRRKILLGTQVGLALSSTVLLLASLSDDPPVLLIYGAVGFASAMSGMASPTRSAMVPNLVGSGQLPAAIALNQVMFNATMIVGPALGGVVIGAAGVAWAYAIDVISYAAGIGAVLLMRPMPPRNESGQLSYGLRAIAEGFRYLRGRKILQTAFAVDLVAMIFGMPRALFPILAVAQFHRGPETVGLLFSAVAFGALGGAITGGWVGRIKHQGQAVLVAVAIWGAGITAFGLVGNRLMIAIACLTLAGAADVISAVFRGTILQTSVPDSLRGRLSGVNILVVMGGPRLGDFEAGLVAQAFGPTVSVVSGGLICLAGVGLIGLLIPAFARYRVDGEVLPPAETHGIE